jgi:hypothetical protein
MEATPIRYRYTIAPSENRHHDLYDATCRLYSLHGEVANPVEAIEAGHPKDTLRCGSMDYIYNTATAKIVCSVGGGSIYISTGWGQHSLEEVIATMDEIGEYIFANPEGGDITEIVEKFKQGESG